MTRFQNTKHKYATGVHLNLVCPIVHTWLSGGKCKKDKGGLKSSPPNNEKTNL
jgi:hypothetical protein